MDKTATATVTVTAVAVPQVSFKFSLGGIKPDAVCLSSLSNKMLVDVMNLATRVYQTGISATFVAVEGEKTSTGLQVFKVSNLAVDKTKFSSVNSNNYLKINGPFHLKRRIPNMPQMQPF